MATNSKVKYDYKFFSEPNDALKCLICLEVASDPWQHGKCGRVFCKECLDKYNEGSCPTCRMDNPQFFEDNRSMREIKGLPVWCKYHDMKCDWVGTVGTLDKHVAECRLVKIPCPNECKDGGIRKVMRKDLHEHLQQCPKRDYECEYCGEKGTYANISQDHDKVCEKKIVFCTNEECDMRMERMKIKNHLANDCEHTVISCKYVSIGCDVKLKRKDMRAHEQDDKAHFKNLIDDVVKWKDKMAKLKKKVAKLQVTAEENTDKLQDLTLEVMILEDTPVTFENIRTRMQLARLQGNSSKMQGHFFYVYLLIALCVVALLAIIFRGSRDLSSVRSVCEDRIRLLEDKLKPQNAVSDGDMESLKRTLNATTQSLQKHVAELEDEMVRFKKEFEFTKITVASFNEKCHAIEVGVNATVDNSKSLQDNVTKIKSKVEKLEDDMAKLEDGTVKGEPIGTMMFNVTKFKKKKDRNEKFTSPSFYTSPNGYHMKIRVYANGRGSGKGSHVSVFSAIVKGKYDAELRWPFVGNITIELLNGLDEKNYYTKVLTPKINLAVGHNWGSFKFIPHSELNLNQVSNTQYLVDNTLYFRVHVSAVHVSDVHVSAGSIIYYNKHLIICAAILATYLTTIIL